MPFFKRSRQELIADSIEDLSQNTNITKLSPGGKARAIIETISGRLEESYEIFDLNLARAFVSSAAGQFLQLIGELLGVSAEPSEAASVTEEMETIKFTVDGGGTFGSINSGTDIIIPVGTQISSQPANGGIVYSINQAKVLRANQAEEFVSASAVAPGEVSNIGSNSIKFHNFTNYTDSNNETLKVTNLHAIQNGKNFESDSNYRFRIINQVLAAEAANETAVRLAALSTPGVADVLIIKHYRGIGTFAVIVKSITPTVPDSLIDAVNANISIVGGLGDIWFILKPKETGLTMRITVQYKNRLDEESFQIVEDSLKEAITDFVNNLDLGESFVVNRLVADLFDVSSDISNFGEAGKPLDEVFIHKNSRTQNNKVRSQLLGDYHPLNDERIIIEPSVRTPIVFERAFDRR